MKDKMNMTKNLEKEKLNGNYVYNRYIQLYFRTNSWS